LLERLRRPVGSSDVDDWLRDFRDWYFDEDERVWFADWRGFHFPASEMFQDARFLGRVNFRDAVFHESAVFESCQFGRDRDDLTDFREARFMKGARFDSCNFAGEAKFDDARGHDAVAFTDCEFGRVASFIASHFESRVSFSGVEFDSASAWGYAEFSDEVEFRDCEMGEMFLNDVSFPKMLIFDQTQFEEANFYDCIFDGPVVLTRCGVRRNASFLDCEFRGLAKFDLGDFNDTYVRSRFLDHAIFWGMCLKGHTTFSRSRVEGVLEIVACAVEGSLDLDLAVGPAGQVTMKEVGRQFVERVGGQTYEELVKKPNWNVLDGSARVYFGPMHLDRVELRDCDVSEYRFRNAVGIESLAVYDVTWPRRGVAYRVGDELDLAEPGKKSNARPTPGEVERICRAFRKNFEDKRDRVGAHGWYVAEMEVGRRYAPKLSLTRLARTFYKATAEYGFSAIRPAVILVIAAAAALALLSVDATSMCVVSVESPSVCAGWETTMRVVLLAIFLQGPPPEALLGGLIAEVIWITLRVSGAAMLIAIAVAFRNQVAR
jgi:uncharacterized protein YjbI with pentapeptide repeats